MLVAAGKAAWQMAHAAVEALDRVDGGVVVTKYEHVKGEILGVNCYEAGHPVPDENSFAATEKALELVQGLTAEDTVLFLLSGGGSALFEKPLLPGTELHALPLMFQLERNGFSVPGDVSLIGYDDSFYTGDIGLTTIRQDPVEMARVAARMALDLIDEKPIEQPYIVFPAQLKVRSSTSRVK